jgi:hypothetical protein
VGDPQAEDGLRSANSPRIGAEGEGSSGFDESGLGGFSLGDPVRLALELSPPAQPSQRSFWWNWLPEQDLGGPLRLSGTGAVAQVRFRPAGGVRLSAELEEPSVAERLYGLRNELFSQAVLDGTVEVVLYPPEPGGQFPGVALALGVRLQSAAAAAMESYLDEVQQQWPFTRQEYQLATPEGSPLRGTCLRQLNVLPELAPCYVTTGETLVVGWNRQVLERALSAGGRGRSQEGSSPPGASGEPSPGSFPRGLAGGSGAVVDFGQWALADQRLAASRSRQPGVRFPLARAELTGVSSAAGGLRFDFLLEGVEWPVEVPLGELP